MTTAAQHAGRKGPRIAVANAWAASVAPDAENRQKDDFYPTPPQGTEALLRVEKFAGGIWEPACGDGAISRVLEAHGHTVVSTDLVDRGFGVPRVDFLMETRALAPNIVTNPPFKNAEEFAERAVMLAQGKVAMLCRLAWLEGTRRRAMFEATKLARVWVFSARLPIWRNGINENKSGGGLIAFAWFVWDRQHVGRPVLGWV